MSLTLSSAALRELVALTEKREKLTSELSAIEAQIAATLGGTTPRASKDAVRKSRQGGRVAKPKKRGKRGATKELILEALKAAGVAGTSVKELSAKLGLKNQNLHVWFNTTGKKLKEIEKTGKGTYRLNESGTKVEAPAAHEKPAQLKASRVSKQKISANKSKRTGKK